MARNKRKNRIANTLAVCFWLCAWQAASVCIGQKLILVSPLEVCGALLALLPTADFWQTAAFSAGRIIGGFLLALALGLALAALAAALRWVEVLLRPLMLVFMITSLETIGDITATSDVSEQPVSGPLYMKRLKGGVLANGLNSFVSAVFNTFPNSCFGQNNGVIQLTGVASRYVGFVVALMLIVLGLFPAVSGFVQHIPEPVLGGATLVMFGTIAASGVRIVSREPLNRRAILIIALSLAVGLGVSQQPLILQFAPEWLKNLLSSGIAAGGITAIVLNLIFPPEKQ